MNDNDTVTQPSNFEGDYEVNVDGAVALYLQLRAKKAELKAWLDDNVKPVNEAMKQVETILLKHLQDTKSNSVSTDHGTVYQRVVRKAAIRDRKAFQEFVIENMLFELLDWRANKVQVFDYIEENKTDVPGVNTSAFMTVGVRKGDETSQEDE